MNDLQIFNYGEIPIRTITRDGEPWWVLADVCRVLGLSNPTVVASRLDDDEKEILKTKLDLVLDIPNRGLTIINESGLYKVILRSDKPEAQKFTRWVTHEVLPAIHKTGSYSVSPLDEYFSTLRNQYNVIQLIGLAADEKHRLERKHNQDPTHRHPLAEWGWTEADCLKYCYDQGFDWDGLYEIFKRVSCWCCPLQSLEELRKLRTHFPDLWERLLDMEHRTWRTFRADYSVDQLEIRFQFEDERLAAGLPINRTREFMSALRKRLEEAGFPQNK